MAGKYICADCGREIPDDFHDFIFDVDAAGRMCMRHLRCPEGRAADDITHDTTDNTPPENTPGDTPEEA